jgi:hypothetical protein
METEKQAGAAMESKAPAVHAADPRVVSELPTIDTGVNNLYNQPMPVDGLPSTLTGAMPEVLANCLARNLWTPPVLPSVVEGARAIGVSVPSDILTAKS